ncbi:MAG: hypothetical protein KAR05_11455, partial [Candidatus Omnitrophica bacterium]|nr:hypothetical protein [Candidatus Omnitrophota bacterium]
KLVNPYLDKAGKLIGHHDLLVAEDPVGHGNQQGQLETLKEARDEHRQDSYGKKLAMTLQKVEKFDVILHNFTNSTISIDFCRGICYK